MIKFHRCWYNFQPEWKGLLITEKIYYDDSVQKPRIQWSQGHVFGSESFRSTLYIGRNSSRCACICWLELFVEPSSPAMSGKKSFSIFMTQSIVWKHKKVGDSLMKFHPLILITTHWGQQMRQDMTSFCGLEAKKSPWLRKHKGVSIYFHFHFQALLLCSNKVRWVNVILSLTS